MIPIETLIYVMINWIIIQWLFMAGVVYGVFKIVKRLMKGKQ